MRRRPCRTAFATPAAWCCPPRCAAAPSSRVSLCSSLKRSLPIPPSGSSSRRPSPQPEFVSDEVNMKTGYAFAVLLVLVLGVYSPGSRLRAAAQPPADQLAADISPEALAQIDALLAEKEGRTAAQTKIDSQLIYEWKMEAGQPVASDIWAVETDLPYAED